MCLCERVCLPSQMAINNLYSIRVCVCPCTTDTYRPPGVGIGIHCDIKPLAVTIVITMET